MKTFNSLRKLREGVGSPAADYTVMNTQDDDEEATTYKPRSKGEEDFANKHTKDTKNHPVAPEDQFKGGTKHSGKHKGYEGAPGEKNVVKAKKTFKELRGQGSSKRRADKSGGDTAMKSVKEEAEFIDENINSLIRKSKLLKRLQEITKKNKPGAVSFKDRDTMTVEPKDAKDIMEVLKKLTSRNAGSMVTKMENGVPGFMNMLDFAKRMAK